MSKEASLRSIKLAKHIAGFATFALLACVLTALLSWFFVNPFKEEARYSIQGMYEQPSNTIQVAVFGPSTLRRGFSPVRLMQKTGLQGYNCFTDAQPVVSSYYLLKELFELQHDTLSVVLLEINSLLNDNDFFNSSIGAERVSGCMRLSPISTEYRWAIAQEYSDVDFLEQMIPLLRYHSRWAELFESDFDKAENSAYQSYFHGQPLLETSYSLNSEKNSFGEHAYDSGVDITDSVDYDKDLLMASWNIQSVKYLDMIISFCRENDIEPVFVKTPASDWDDFSHDSANLFANDKGVAFVDMMKSDIWNECDLSFDADYYDNLHPNFNGSLKLTDWLGDYLTSHYCFKAVTPGASQAFSEQDFSHLDQVIEDAHLSLCATLEEYLRAADNERYTVFIVAQGESSSKLSQEARDIFAQWGLKKLAKLAPNQPYIGVLYAGECILDLTSTKESTVFKSGEFDGYSVKLNDAGISTGDQFTHQLLLSSTGTDKGAKSSVEVNSVEQSEKERGLNFVIYNNESGLLVDTSCFDTHTGSKRTSDLLED